MKILLSCAGYPPDIKGGGEISTQLLAQGLAHSGHEVQVLTISDVPCKEKVNGVDIQRIDSPNIYWNFKGKHSLAEKLQWHFLENTNPRAKRLMRDYIRNYQPELVITSTTENFGTSVWKAANDCDVPSVHILRSYNTMCPRAGMFKNSKNCTTSCVECVVASYGKKKASQQVSGIIGLSRHILKKHREAGYFMQAEPIVLPNFIPDTILEKAKKTVDKTLGNPVTFGYMGTLSSYKGLDVLVEAYQSIAQETKARLLIAGDGKPEYVADLKERLKDNNVTFLGWVDQSELLENIDFLIVPSLWHEPLGRVVLEAFSYGVPVLGSDRGGIPDMIRHGYNGFLFDPDFSDTLVESMKNAMGDPDKYHTLSKAALFTLDEYSEKVMVTRYVEYFEKIVRNYR